MMLDYTTNRHTTFRAIVQTTLQPLNLELIQHSFSEFHFIDDLGMTLNFSGQINNCNLYLLTGTHT
jgi:hypothetical protein